ncbi:MAG: L,D-transpeptidase [bacterium]
MAVLKASLLLVCILLLPYSTIAIPSYTPIPNGSDTTTTESEIDTSVKLVDRDLLGSEAWESLTALKNVQVISFRLGKYVQVTDGSRIYDIKLGVHTYIYSASRTEGLKLKEYDIVNIYYEELDTNKYMAEVIYLAYHPTPREVRIIKNKTSKDFIYLAEDPEINKKIKQILIDRYHQKVFIYGEENILLAISRCVTGKSGWATPRGNFKIYTKERNRYLDGRRYGEDYHLWVYYWMPFYDGAGLHDAGWRYTFDVNNTYYGSHGCVNLPFKTAKFIFENSSIGTSVIVL